MAKVFIIAEAGVNHNGSLKTAKQMVDAAVKAGADAVKFQTFHAAAMVSKSAAKAGYQKRSTDKTENQLEMLQRLEMGLKSHQELLRYCRKKKIIFLSTPFDMGSIELLAGLGLGIFIIPSGEITNLPYLRKIGSLRKKIIMSTGMSDLKEIKAALDVLLKSGARKKDITILHCNTEYPTPFKDVNLRAMGTIRKALGVKVGYSDHTLGIEIPVAATALGACVIEKHFTLDRDKKGPDHKASLEPDELALMVRAVRNIENSLGNGIKKPSGSESKNIKIARKSIVAATGIKRGMVFSSQNITVKRPGTGISPMQWDKVIGMRAGKNFRPDELIRI
jgi:N,N'-diacetyllegionaminate synthase